MENIIIDEKISAAIEEHRGHSDAHGGPFALDNHTHKELDDILEEIEKLSAQIEEVSAEFDHVNSEIHKHTEDGKGEAHDPHTYYATEEWALANLKLNLLKIHQEGPDNTPGAYLREGRETWSGALYGDELKDRLNALSAEFDDMASELNELREWYNKLATSADDLSEEASELGKEAQQKAQYYAEGVSALNHQADSIRDRIARLSGDFNEPVEYQVKHYKAFVPEGSSPRYPSEASETETLSGNIGDQTNAQAKEYDGYYCCGSYPGSAQGPSGSPEQKTLTKNGNNDIDIYYSLNFYNVYFETDGGSPVESVTAYYDVPLYTIAPQNPSKQGYEFEGWDFGGLTNMPAHDITLSAKWHAGSTTYTVTHLYENLEGNYDQENVETQYGTTGLSTNAQANNKNPAGFDTLPFEQQVISADGSTNVDIKYDRKTFTVTWYPGIEGMDPGEESYKYEASCSIQPAPSRDGYMFDGWWRNGLSVTSPFQVTENTSISAHWKECNASYEVKHYQETDTCPDDSPEYMLQESEILNGRYGESTQATAKQYEGFSSKPFNQKTIEEGQQIIVEIYYDRNKVVLSLYDDGSVLSTLDCKYNKPIPYQIDNPTKEGYVFKQWEPMIPYSISSDYSCSAMWNKNKHTLHLEYGFDDMLPDDIEYEYGATLSVDNPGRGKYEFKRWDPSLPETMPDNDLTATAQWELSAVDYYLHHDREKLDGTYETYGVSRLSGVVGEQANLSTETYEGFTAEPPESHTLTKEDEEQVFTIKYKRNTYTVSFDASEYFNVSQSNTYKYDEDFPTPPTVENTEEREFLGWQDETGADISSFPLYVTENKSYKAKSKEPDTVTYTIKHLGEELDSEDYSVNLETETLTGRLNSTVECSAKQFTGFNPPSSGTTSITLSADGIEVEFNYDRKEYLISFEDEDDSIPAYDSSNYKYETPWSEVTVPTPTKEHYNFTEWDAEFPETVTEDKIFHAKWTIEQHTYTEKHYAETLSGDYEEISSNMLTVDYGTEVEFSGNPPYGFHVKEHSPSTTISGDGIELSAKYERNTYSLYWDFCLDDGSSPIFKVYKYETPKSEYEDDDPEVPEREGYTFDGWTELPEKLTADTTVSAKWISDEHESVTVTVNYRKLNLSAGINAWPDEENTEQFDSESFTVDYGTSKSSVDDQLYNKKDAKMPDGFRWQYYECDPEIGDNLTCDLTCTIFYNREKYTVTWDDGIEETENSSFEYLYETAKATMESEKPADPTREGYTFDGWTELPETLTADTTISAKWKRSCVITVHYKKQQLNGGGYVHDWEEFDTATITVDYGSSGNDVKLSVYEKTPDGFEVAGYTTFVDTTITKDETAEVAYRRLNYTVTWDDGIEGTENPSHQYQYETPKATMEADKPADPTRENYTFDEWTDLPEMLTADTTVSAKWKEKEKFTVYFYAEDADGVQREYESYELYSGEVIYRPSTNPTRENYEFTGWMPENKIGTKISQNEGFAAQWTQNPTPYSVVHIKHDNTSGKDVTETLGSDDCQGTLGQNIIIAHKNVEGYSPTDPTSLTLTAENQEFTVNYWPNVYKLTVNSYPKEAGMTPYTSYVTYQQNLSDHSAINDHPTEYQSGDSYFKWNSWKNCPETMPANDLTVDSVWDVAYPYTLSSSYRIEFTDDSEPEEGHWKEYSGVAKPGETITENRPSHGKSYEASGPESVSFTMPEESYSDTPWHFESPVYEVTFTIASSDLSRIEDAYRSEFPKTKKYAHGQILGDGPSVRTNDGSDTSWSFPNGYAPGSSVDQDLTATLVLGDVKKYRYVDKVEKYPGDSPSMFSLRDVDDNDGEYYTCQPYTRITGRAVGSYENHSRIEPQSTLVNENSVTDVETHFYLDLLTANYYVPDGVLTGRSYSDGYVECGKTESKYKVGSSENLGAYFENRGPVSDMQSKMIELRDSIPDNLTSFGHFAIPEFKADSDYSGGTYDFEYKFIQEKSAFKYKYFVKNANGSYEEFYTTGYQGIGNIGTNTSSNIQDGSSITVNGKDLTVVRQRAETIAEDPSKNFHEIYCSKPICTINVGIVYYDKNGHGPYGISEMSFSLTGYPGEKTNYKPQNRISYNGARYILKNNTIPENFPENSIGINISYEYEEDEF